jgi:hypothetical protein
MQNAEGGGRSRNIGLDGTSRTDIRPMLRNLGPVGWLRLKRHECRAPLAEVLGDFSRGGGDFLTVLRPEKTKQIF